MLLTCHPLAFAGELAVLRYAILVGLVPTGVITCLDLATGVGVCELVPVALVLAILVCDLPHSNVWIVSANRARTVTGACLTGVLVFPKNLRV